MTVAALVFWLCLGVLFYIYVGYPAACWLLAAMLRRDPRAEAYEPSVTVLIAAYNEAAVIAETVRNKLDQDYPRERLDVIVVSDGSDDGTDDIVTACHDERVRLLRQDPRSGKSAALNLGLKAAGGEIVVFADANSLYAPTALRELMKPLADPAVGYVTGSMAYKAVDGSPTGQGCSAYMRYENRLRRWETRLGSIVGADGGIDAMRRSLVVPLRADQLPDLALPLAVVARGFRVVHARRALLHEDALAEARDEFRMRVRVALRAWHILKERSALLRIWRYGFFSWQLFSHKWLRYLAFVFQVGALLANVVLVGESLFWPALLLQVGFYGLAGWGYVRRRRSGWPGATAAYYLCLVNAASAVAFWRFLRGQRQVLWTPRTR
jgi:cellulose synthase/poly-beta-1,6-N-acetylglucosamine synthase-like glycosyltransferase